MQKALNNYFILIIYVLMMLFPCPALAEELKAPKLFEGRVEKPDSPEVKNPEDSYKLKVWKFVKGKPVKDSVILGMWSKHTSENRHKYNETNEMYALQYKGFVVGTFKNSYYNRTYIAGVARKVLEKEFNKDTTIDLQYKAGFMHGYKDKYPNVAGVTPVILPVIGVNYKLLGVDFLIIPSDKPIFTGSFRLNAPQFKNRNKQEVELN